MKKLTSPSIPTINPRITTNNAEHVSRLVFSLSSIYVKKTFETMESDLATLSTSGQREYKRGGETEKIK